MQRITATWAISFVYKRETWRKEMWSKRKRKELMAAWILHHSERITDRNELRKKQWHFWENISAYSLPGFPIKKGRSCRKQYLFQACVWYPWSFDWLASLRVEFLMFVSLDGKCWKHHEGLSTSILLSTGSMQSNDVIFPKRLFIGFLRLRFLVHAMESHGFHLFFVFFGMSLNILLVIQIRFVSFENCFPSAN